MSTMIGRYFSLEEFVAASRGPGGKGTLALTAQEIAAARWWATAILDALRQRIGRPVYINSFVRSVEIKGPRIGQTETGPHGRQYAPGNAVDISASGFTPLQTLAELQRLFPGTSPIWAKLDGGDHVHMTRQAIPGSIGGVGKEVTRADGSTGVDPIPGYQLVGMGTPASGPGVSTADGPPGTLPPHGSTIPILLGSVAGLALIVYLARR